MSLPKTKYPLFETQLPSNGKTVTFRQMLVRDEKVLLMAKASEDENDVYRSVKQVVNNCMFDQNIDSLTTFDIEWMFLRIRAASIGNVVELTFLDKEDEKEYNFNVDLDEITVSLPEYEEGQGNLVKVTDDLGLLLRYPPASLFDEDQALGEDSYEYIASRCIDKIFDGDETYLADDCTKEELLEYILDLDTKSYQSIRNFIASTPHLFYEISYTNSKGTERKISLTTLTDFFTLR
jgi:hypothetical protein